MDSSDNNIKKQKKILREFVELVLLEDDGDYSDALSGIQNDYQNSFGTYGGGSSYGGPGSLKAAFIDPVLDIVKTGLWGLEKLSVRAKNFLKQIIVGALPLVFPVVKLGAEGYQKLLNKEKEDLAKIDAKYGPVLQRNMEAIQASDTWLFLFMIDPYAAMGEKLLEKAPGVVEELLAALVGMDFSTAKKRLQETDNTGESNPNVSKEDLKKILADKKFQQRFLQSPTVQKMQKDGVMLMINPVKQMLAAETPEQLNALMSGALTKSLQAINGSQFSPQEKQVMVGNLMTQAKKAAVDSITKELNELVKKHPTAKAAVDAALATIQQK